MPQKNKPIPLTEDELLLREGRKIVEALGKMLAPCCEVLLHDLRTPDHSIVAIENSISRRKVGDSATEMGLARIGDPAFPDVVQNYPNTFPDGRPAKSTSIGMRNSKGDYIASLCLNLDVSLLGSVQRILEQLTNTDTAKAPVQETLRARSIEGLREAIEAFSAQQNVQPLALSLAQRRELVKMLDASGLLHLRNATSITAEMLGVTRASIYNLLKPRENMVQ